MDLIERIERQKLRPAELRAEALRTLTWAGEEPEEYDLYLPEFADRYGLQPSVAHEYISALARREGLTPPRLFTSCDRCGTITAVDIIEHTGRRICVCDTCRAPVGEDLEAELARVELDIADYEARAEVFGVDIYAEFELSRLRARQLELERGICV